MSKENLKKAYQKLKVKYKLPDFDKLNNEFEIAVINPDKVSFLLRAIRRKINNKLIMYCDLMQRIIMPETSSVINLHETRFFDEKDKEFIGQTLKDLMKIERQTLVLDTNSTERDESDWIKFVFKKWVTLKKPLMTVAEKMRDCWGEEHMVEEFEKYFG